MQTQGYGGHGGGHVQQGPGPVVQTQATVHAGDLQGHGGNAEAPIQQEPMPVAHAHGDWTA